MRVYWHRSDRTAGPEPGSICPTWPASSPSISADRVRAARVRVDHRATAVLGGLDRRLAVAGEAVERRLVHPDPQRHPVRREVLGPLGREVRRLLERHRQRDLVADAGEHLVGPGVGADDHAPAGVRRAVLDASTAASRSPTRRTASVLQHRAVPDGQLLHDGGAGSGRDDRAALLVEPDGAGRQRELRPARRDLVDVEQLEADADLACERRCSRSSGSPGSAGKRSSPPTTVTSSRPAASESRAQSSYASCGQPDVLRRVIAVPQDPAGVVAGAAAVAELEALEPEHREAARGQLVRRRRAERAEPDDDVVVVSHRIRPPSLGSSQRRMSAQSSSIGANHPCV